MTTNRRTAARDNTGGPSGQATVREEWAIRWSNGVLTPPSTHRDQAERRLAYETGLYPHGDLVTGATVVCRTVTVTDWAVPSVSVVPEPPMKREPAVDARVRMRHFPSITGTVISCCAPSIQVRWDHDSRVRELALNLVEPETP